jgi:hypothetical protein
MAYLPTLVGIMGSWLGGTARKDLSWLMKFVFFWLLGFWAAFGTQFAVVQLFPEDQGKPAEVVRLAGERVAALPSALPRLLSGSSYVARYTGQEFPPTVRGAVTAALGVLVVAALTLAPQRKAAAAWAAGLLMHLAVLVIMVDRFTLRYFVVFVLGMWVLAGVGAYALTKKLVWLPVAVALILIVWTTTVALVPYLEAGGSTRVFSLGRYSDSAADFVDIRPLVACVKQAGPVWADNPHIHNRLLFLSRGDKDIWLPLDRNQANWIIDYRLPSEKPGVHCPELVHFRLSKRK